MSQKVVNNPLGSYAVATDAAIDATQRQAVGLDIGDVNAGVWTPSRVSSANPLPVTVVGGGGGAQDVNITKYGGTSTTLGQKTMSASAPVALASDQSAIPITDNGGSVTVDGSVTANAGTNLNTSLLALESGGNLATLAGAVSSSRVQTNPISGQVGVQGGSGTVSNTTQRVVLATDIALPAGTNALGTISNTVTEAVYSNGSTANTSGSYAQVLAAPSNPWRMLRISNQSDAGVRISFDGGSTLALTVPQGAIEYVEYYKWGLKESSAVHSRYDAAAATTGSVEMVGFTT